MFEFGHYLPLRKMKCVLFKVNAPSKVALTMDTHQTESCRKVNSCHMVTASSTLVMHRTLWMAPTFCIATTGRGTQVFLLARVCCFPTIEMC